MSRQVVKANKLVEKATSVFGASIIKVEKANDILEFEINKDYEAIMLMKAQIEKLNEGIENLNLEIKGKSDQIGKNNELLTQLYSFIPQ